MTSTQARNKAYRAQLRGDYATATIYMEKAKRLEAEEIAAAQYLGQQDAETVSLFYSSKVR